MQTTNRFFDDLAKVVNGAAGTVAGMAREVESGARERARDWVDGLDLVSRDEFDALKDMLAAAQAEIAALRTQVDALSGGGSAAAPAAKPKAAKSRKAPPAA